jgi:nitronate monooxygenase
MTTLIHTLDIGLPIIQAPMASVATPALAAAVSNAGGLGSIAVGHVDAETARGMISAVRAVTGRPFIVNVFCHSRSMSGYRWGV